VGNGEEREAMGGENLGDEGSVEATEKVHTSLDLPKKQTKRK